MSNTEIVGRIDSVLKEKNLKRQAVYDYANIAYNTFPNWVKKEDTKIPAQALYKISEFLEVSMEWLLTGKERNVYKEKYERLKRKVEEALKE